MSNQIRRHDRPFAVLDFGCGEGRFLAALLANGTLPLGNIHYVGVDSDSQRLAQAQDYANSVRADHVLASAGFCTALEQVDLVLRPHRRCLLPKDHWDRRKAGHSLAAFRLKRTSATSLLSGGHHSVRKPPHCKATPAARPQPARTGST
ncbi:MAG: class I SAM-dependent methyltransferase [bacterium]|nr:class I SAM-dependent methyltransferase [bacterium]